MTGQMDDAAKYLQDKYPGAFVKYFTWDEKDHVETFLRAYKNADMLNDVAVIGHSWGGDTAAEAVADGYKVGALITIDPVSRDAPDLKAVKENAGTWINVNANPNWEMRSNGYLNGNNVAGVGGAWNNRPRGYADQHYNANFNHGNPWAVLPIP